MALRVGAAGSRRLTGIPGFAIMWAGQSVSLVGSGLTTFALGVWLFEHTGSLTQFTLNGVFATLPLIVVSPVAGAWADRHNRRWVMLLSDSGSALATLAVGLLLFASRLDIWHVYLATVALTIGGIIQGPAYAAAVPLLVPKEHLGRANGLIGLGRSATSIIAPALGGLLVHTIGLRGIVVLDLATYLVAAGTLLLIDVPRPSEIAASRTVRGSFFREAMAGWQYQASRPGLLALLLFFTALNLTEGVTEILRVPLVLSLASPAMLGGVMSAAGIGAVASSTVMSIWGGPKHRIHGVLVFTLLAGMSLILVGLRASIALITFAYVLRFVCGPVFSGCAQAILQSKVAPNMQGRVFATSMVTRGLARSLAYLAAGPLVDHVFEPGMAPDGAMAHTLGRILGTGPGRGIGLLISLGGLVVVALCLGGYLYPRLRRIENELPDVFSGQDPSRG